MEHYKVCVAESNREVASKLGEDLQQNNYDVVTVDSGDKAIEVCTGVDVDILLLDAEISGIRAIDVCDFLRRTPDTDGIAIVMAAERSQQGVVEDLLTKGLISEFVKKPYNLPFVLMSLDSAIRSRELSHATINADNGVHDNAYTDRLTGLRNRRFLLERLQEEIDKATQYNYPISCAILDIDSLEALDAELGAVSIDDLLAELALSLRSNSRTYDLIARFDNTLFAAVLPHSHIDNAIGFAKKIISEVDSTTFSEPAFPTNAKLHFGLVECGKEASPDAEEVLGEAMRALFQAKSSNNRQIVARLQKP